MASVCLLGATGMVGSHILSTLRNASPTTISSIDIIARRSPSSTTTASTPIIPREHIEKDTAKWPSFFAAIKPMILFSSLATTRGAAGGLENQYKLEHDLNIELAKKAKEAGTKTYVLISAAGSNPSSMFAYPKMKGEIEEHVKELDFEHTIILRPGLIGGHREESRPAEAVYRGIAKVLGHISSMLVDPWVQDADVIARAAVQAALKVETGEVKEKVWMIYQKDIIKLGKHEWKGV